MPTVYSSELYLTRPTWCTRMQRLPTTLQVSPNIARHQENSSRNNVKHSKFEKAAVHIIVRRTLRQRWTLKSGTVPVDVNELGKLVDEVLKTYKDYFGLVIVREPWTEKNCIADFTKILEEVLPSDEPELNWTRIAMFIALATRVAQHLYQNGASEKFVQEFARCIGGILEDRVQTWDQSIDRWAALRSSPKDEESSTTALKYFLGAGLTVVSLITTVAGLGSTSPFFLDKLKN